MSSEIIYFLLNRYADFFAVFGSSKLFLIRSSDVALEISSYLTLTDAEQLQLEPEFYYSVITDVLRLLLIYFFRLRGLRCRFERSDFFLQFSVALDQ